MISLLLETSGRDGFVALAEGDDRLRVVGLDRNRRHARDLAPAVGRLLADAGLTPDRVDCVAVSQGPGSYTGLRVGMASALAFRFATGCHLILAPTFALLAEMVGREILPDGDRTGARLEIIADALKGWIYDEAFACDERGIWQSVRPLAVRTVDRWLESRTVDAPVVIAAEDGPAPGSAFPGSPAPIIGGTPGQAGAAGQVLVAGTLGTPARVAPQAMARWVLRRAAAQAWDDSDSAEPLYLRPSSAELQMANAVKGNTP